MQPDLSAAEQWLASKSATERKQLGQWATPWWVIEQSLPHILVGVPIGATVLDPACGDGRWLLGVHRLRPDLKLRGNDLDPAAIEAARATLAAAGVPAELTVGDALAETPLPSVDLVVGNPPFVRPQNLPKAQREAYWARFATATDKSDLYACFVERCTELAPRVALVLPNTWLSMASFEALRAHLTAFGIDTVWELPERTFPSARVKSALLLADARKPTPRAGAMRPGHSDRAHPLTLGPGPWSLTGPLPELPGPPLGDFAKLYMGVVCGDYDRYVHDRPRTPEHHKTSRGKQVQRWYIEDGGEYLWYVPQDMLARKPYVAPKHAGIFDLPEKVVIAGASGASIRAAMDTERRYVLDSCNIALPTHAALSPWTLLGVLLSSPVQDWYGRRYPAARTKGVELSRIPFPTALWDEIADAARAQDDAALDAVVERAYALTE